MYCAKCGREIDSNAAFCPYCGEKTGCAPAEKNNDVKTENAKENTVGITAAPETPAAETYAAPAAPEAPAAETYAAPAAHEAPAADTYTAPAAPEAPAADTYTAPAAPEAPAADTYTAPAAPEAPAAETYAAPAAPEAPAADTYTAPAAPAADTYAAPAAPAAPAADTYAAPTAGAYAAPEQGYYQPAPAPTAPETPKKKMKLWLKLLLFIGIPVVVIAALIAINFNALKGLFVKNFMSADAYIATVEGDSLKEYYDAVTNIYAKGVGTVVSSTSDGSASAELNFSLSDSFAEMLGDSAYTDLSWLSDITVKTASSSENGVTATDVDILLGESKITSFTQTIDTESGKTYLSVPDLSSQVIAVDGAAVDNEYSVSDIIEFVSELPEAERLNALLAKYVEIVLRNIEGTQMADGTIAAGGIEQQCTELRLEFDKALLQKIFTAVIEEMKNDGELKDIIISLEDSGNELFGTDDVSGEEVYDNFLSALDALLDNVNSIDGSELGDKVFTLTDYVDSHNKIIGRKIETAEDGRTYFIGKATANGKTGIELDLDGEITVKGTGNEKGSLINGDYVLFVQGSEILNFRLEDFDTDSLKNGMINGDITLELGRVVDGMFYYGSEDNALAMLRQFAYKISARTDNDSYSLSLSALSGDEEAIALSVSGGTKKGSGKAVIPDADIECEHGDGNAIDAWIDGMDFDSLEKKLEDAGVPSQFAPYLRYYLTDAMYSLAGVVEIYDDGNDGDWYYDDRNDYDWNDDWYDDNDDWYNDDNDDWYNDDWYNDDNDDWYDDWFGDDSSDGIGSGNTHI